MSIHRNRKLLTTLVNKQFEMKGINLTLEKIDSLENCMVEIEGKKKKEIWYNHYKFDNEQEYMEWRHWIEEELKKADYYDIEKEANYVDSVYGMIYKYR